MDRIKKKFVYGSFFFTGIFIGGITGILGLNTVMSVRIDYYQHHISYLEGVIEEQSIRLNKLEESVNSKKFILKNIEVIIDGEIDEVEKISLEKHIKEKYIKLLGKEVKNIDIDMSADVIDKRIMKLNEKEYQLDVERIALADILKIWIYVNKIDSL